jgi:hypothetical protein
MSEKAKVDKPSKARIHKYGFLAMWIGAQVFGWLALILLSNLLSNLLFPLFIDSAFFDIIMGSLMGLIIGIPTAIGQKLALYLHYGRWFKTWIRTNTIAWILGGLAITLLSMQFSLPRYGQFGLLAQVLSLMLPSTLAQIWVLRNHVQKTWLWLLAAVAATSVFAGVMGQNGSSNEAAIPAFGLYSLVTGLSLLWIMGMQREEGKLKMDADTSRLEETAEENAVEPDDVELEPLANKKVM